MELDYSKIHHSRKICGTEQAEFIEDKRLRDILTMRLYKNAKGSWEAPLPFKSDNLSLADNKGHCLRSFLSLNRWLLNESKRRKYYLVVMKKTLDNDHASQVLSINSAKRRQSIAPSPLTRITTQENRIRSKTCLPAVPPSRTSR